MNVAVVPLICWCGFFFFFFALLLIPTLENLLLRPEGFTFRSWVILKPTVARSLVPCYSSSIPSLAGSRTRRISSPARRSVRHRQGDRWRKPVCDLLFAARLLSEIQVLFVTVWKKPRLIATLFFVVVASCPLSEILRSSSNSRWSITRTRRLRQHGLIGHYPLHLNGRSTQWIMRCNVCWRELEGQAFSTTCGHLLCTEDASKIVSSDGACPICDQVLSKSLMRPVDINPSDEWTNMAMAGVSPQILMNSAYRSVTFYIGQKELEMQYKMNKIIGQFQQKCESMQEKFTEKMEQMHTAYQKMVKRCQMFEQENESLLKDKQELQEKYSEKSRQKRKLDEMYDQLRSEYESMKRSAIQPASNFFTRAETSLFSNMANMMGGSDTPRQDRSVFTPETPGQREGVWASTRPKNSAAAAAFDLSGRSPPKMPPVPIDSRASRPARPVFGAGVSNPAATLRNLVISPMKRPQLSRNRSNLFTL